MAPNHRRRPDLRSIADRGAAMHDSARTASATHARPADVARRLRTWREVAAGGDVARFARRLRWDGIDDANAELIVGGADVTAARGGELPQWLLTVADAYAWGGGEAPRVMAEDFGAGILDAEEPLPFETLLLPLVALAQERLARIARESLTDIASEVTNGVLRGLLRRLTHICAVSLYADFAVHRALNGATSLAAVFGVPEDVAPDTEYQRFVHSVLSERLVSFFEQYPVAARLCGTVVDQWVASMAEFFARLRADTPDLALTFAGGQRLGTVVSVTADAGDTHDGGRSVFLIRFGGGLTLVYKPRAIPLEECFGDLVAWLNASGECIDLRTPLRIARTTHGWIEFIASGSCADRAAAERFYRRSGMLLALVYGVNGTDFHIENLIAGGEHPVLIDMEALLGHRFEMEDRSWDVAAPLEEASRQLRQSVLTTCLLPGNYMGRNGATDIGGLAAATAHEPDALVATWRNVNRDAMQVVHAATGAVDERQNAPVLDGVALDGGEFVSDIVDGFRAAYVEPADFAGQLERAASVEQLRRIPIARDSMGALQQMLDGKESFWDVVHRPYLQRELSRGEAREIIAQGLDRTRGSYKRLVPLFNMAPTDYLKFMDFLRHQELKAD